MNYAEAEKVLRKCGQEHVLAYWKKLGGKEREALLGQIAKIDPKSVRYCQEALAKGAEVPDSSKGRAPKVAVLKGRKLAEAVAVGEKELRAGRVAALLVAGGQGSRLGYDGPKGCYSIGPITGAPLFYFHARKILARTVRYGRTIPFYVMTSEANNEATVRCFEENDYFGLNPDDVFFFTQGMWPGMTKDGKIIMDAPGHVFMSPDGHGGLLAALKRSGALADMKRRGIRSVFFFQVDNPLVEVADPAALRPVAAYDPAGDIEWFAADAPRPAVLLPAGSFLVLWPHEAHQPGVATARGTVAVRKVVVKVALG